jgi:hypothetical protein
MIKSFVVRLLFLENAGNEDGIEWRRGVEQK